MPSFIPHPHLGTTQIIVSGIPSVITICQFGNARLNTYGRISYFFLKHEHYKVLRS